MKTPLGFFTLAIVILEGILLAESVTTGQIEPWMPFLLMALVIILVFVLAIIKPETVGVQQITKHPEIIVTMKFPENPNVNFDDDCGELSIKKTGKKKTKETFTPTANEEGGWYHSLPNHVTPGDQIRINLNDTTGTRWRTKPFIPRLISQELTIDPGRVPTDGGG